ncbi:MAG: hypothetical protein LBB59_06220 [Campylobacteraceae bacterium]|jgi:hypothetical protein|nr:hypothetical protein [Campylobacteraceae bacterium]
MKTLSKLSALFIFSVVILTGCGGSGGGETSTLPPQTPSITEQPKGASYNQNDPTTPLSVTATVSGGGSLSYQWYQSNANGKDGWTAIDGAIASTYDPPTSAPETAYYYVEVANAKNGAIAKARSGIAAVYVGTIPADFILITTAEQLYSVRSALSGKYILGNDISLSSYGGGWEPIGSQSAPFTGTLDGNGFKITELYVNNQLYAGLFGYASGALIKNLGVEISEQGVNGKEYAGGIAGAIDGGVIIGCSSVGNISAIGNGVGVRAGGIAGLASGANISKSYSAGGIFGSGKSALYGSYVGGIAGFLQNDGNISISYSTADVSVSNGYAAGGVVGVVHRNSAITDSYSTGNISGFNSSVIGGIAGASTSGMIDNSYSTGNLTAVTGGYGGGGIVAFGSGGYITDCAAANYVISSGNRIIALTDYDRDDFFPVITNNFANSAMLVNGAVVGDGEYSGTGKTLEELQTRSTYENEKAQGGLGWKFGSDDENPWKMPLDGGFPILYWQE